jgi:hypothetical protein
MAANKCKLPYYKDFFPAATTAPLTGRQLDILSKATPARRFKYWGAVVNSLDDPTMDILEKYSRVKGDSIKSKTRKGQTLNEIEQDLANKVSKVMQQNKLESLGDTEDFVNSFTAKYKKGQLLSEAQREILYPIVEAKRQRLPSLMSELETATAAGDKETAAALSIQLQETAAAFATLIGDKNAVSIALNSYKRLNEAFTTGGTVNQLFRNGDCL